MTVEIRPVPPEELRAWFESVMVAFGEDVNEDQWKLDQLTLEPDRILGGYDGDQIVGGGGAFSFQMTVPGGIVPVAGVTMVGVMPTHRRQGVLRALMARQLADVRAAGEPMAALWASEGSIYQRFGYGLATVNGSVDIERDRSAFRKPVAADGQRRAARHRIGTAEHHADLRRGSSAHARLLRPRAPPGTRSCCLTPSSAVAAPASATTRFSRATARTSATSCTASRPSGSTLGRRTS